MAPGWIGAWMRGLMGGHRREYIQPPRNLLKPRGLWVWPSARCYCLLHCFIPIDRRCSSPLSIMTFYKHSGKYCYFTSTGSSDELSLDYVGFFYNDFSTILSSLNVVLMQNVRFGWENSKWIVIKFTLKKTYFFSAGKHLTSNFSIFFNWQQKKIKLFELILSLWIIFKHPLRGKCKT